MSWNTLSAADALLSPQEKTSLATIASGADQLQKIADREIAAWRGAILAGGGRVDQDGTLPDQILPEVLAVIAWRYLLAYPELKKLQTDERRQLYGDALALKQEISAGRQKVELPASGQALSTTGPMGQVEVANTTKRRLTRDTLEGL